MSQQGQEVNQVAMEVDILENKIVTEHLRVADKSILRGKHRKSENNFQDNNTAGSEVVAGQEDHHPSGHARDGAVATNVVFVVAGAGEPSEEQQHSQEQVLAVGGTGEAQHLSGHARDSALVTNVVVSVAGEGGIAEQKQCASGQPQGVVGEDQQFHAHHGAGVGDKEPGQLATIGNGFKTEFRKIARARRRYCGGPDGMVQVCLTDLGFNGECLGGGKSSTLSRDKKRKVEREPNLFLKKRRLS